MSIPRFFAPLAATGRKDCFAGVQTAPFRFHPHRRSIVLAAADRSPRFADGSLVCSRSNNAVAAYLPSSPPACCRHIVGRRRIVTRRLQRPRSKATQCTKCTASYTHSGHCACVAFVLVAVCPAPLGLLVIGCRRLLPRHRLDHKSRQHQVNDTLHAVSPQPGGAPLPPAPAAYCSDANGLQSPASAPRPCTATH